MPLGFTHETIWIQTKDLRRSHELFKADSEEGKGDKARDEAATGED
jgi:hypothetical protein